MAMVNASVSLLISITCSALLSSTCLHVRLLFFRSFVVTVGELMLSLTVKSIGLDDGVVDYRDADDPTMDFVMDVSNSVGSVNAEHADGDNDP